MRVDEISEHGGEKDLHDAARYGDEIMRHDVADLRLEREEVGQERHDEPARRDEDDADGDGPIECLLYDVRDFLAFSCAVELRDCRRESRYDAHDGDEEHEKKIRARRDAREVLFADVAGHDRIEKSRRRHGELAHEYRRHDNEKLAQFLTIRKCLLHKWFLW